MERQNSIDSYRLFAAFAVIILHVSIGAVPYEITVYIRLICRFAVPFFFLVSGYFFYFGYKKSGNDFLLKSIKRLASIYIIAWIVYIPKAISKNTLRFDETIFLVGNDGHLWFISSLIFGLMCCWYILTTAKNYVFLFIVGTFFLLPILVYYYSGDKVLQSNMDFILCRFLISLPFLALGMFFSYYKVNISKLLALVLIALSLILMFGEVNYLKSTHLIELWSVQFLLNTVPLSIGIFFLSFKTVNSALLGDLGRKYSLGIYLYHPLVNTATFHGLKYVFKDGVDRVLIINPFVCFFSTLVILILINKYLPRVFNILNGEFNKKVIAGGS